MLMGAKISLVLLLVSICKVPIRLCRGGLEESTRKFLISYCGRGIGRKIGSISSLKLVAGRWNASILIEWGGKHPLSIIYFTTNA